MRLAACIEYDGSGFSGWQSQAGQAVRFIQTELEKALSRVADQEIAIVCAGRTDTGVHATNQIIHFDTSAERQERSWILGSNVNLPDEIAVRWVMPVAEDFHARFSARTRSYRYIIDNRWIRPAILRHRVTWYRHELDIRPMQQAAEFLVGTHDFTSYRSLACQAKNPVRDLQMLNIQRQGEFVIIDIRANAFLHHMVRNIAGVLMAIGSGEREPNWAWEVLEAKDRSLGGVTAPAAGLYLVGVAYPDKYKIPAQSALPSYA